MTEPQLIQPTGFTLSLSPDWLISAVSANIGDFLPVDSNQALGKPVTFLLTENSIHDMRNRMALLRSDEAVEHLLRVALVDGGKPFDLSIFRDGKGYGIDAEPSDGHSLGDATAMVEGMLARIAAATDVTSIANEAARQLRALTGFDRVLVVGDGTVLGQSIRPGQAEHALAPGDGELGHLAVTDWNANPVTVLSMVRDRPTRSTLRMASDHESHCIASQHARAALIIPIQREGQCWGHVGCYHSAPRHVGIERRSVASLFARFLGLKIENAALRAR